MNSYSPFEDYLEFSGALFNTRRETEEKNESSMDKASSKSPQPQDNYSRRLRTVSASSVETDFSDDMPQGSDPGFRFLLPKVPERGRPLLPQRTITTGRSATSSVTSNSSCGPKDSSADGITNDSSNPDSGFTVREDLDRMELMSSASDLQGPCNRYDKTQDTSSSTVGGMMEQFVLDVFERKIRNDRYSRPTVCVFCQRNGETVEYYSTHVLKDNRGKVICPVLRNYVCPNCQATGDTAHTLRHCPKSRNQASIAETFKTPRTSSGIRKF